MEKSRSYRQDQLPILVQKLLEQAQKYSIFAFYGPLGAGKSTIIRQMLSQMGIAGKIPSPTFTYVNTYELRGGRIAHHFDLYRLEEEGEFTALGLEELLADSNAVSLVEWPEVVEGLLNSPGQTGRICRVYVDYEGDLEDVRRVEIKGN